MSAMGYASMVNEDAMSHRESLWMRRYLVNLSDTRKCRTVL